MWVYLARSNQLNWICIRKERLCAELRSYVMEGFVKTESCPSSEELLSFQTGDIKLAESAVVRRHLLVCEFCDAEVRFYELFPPGEFETVETDEIPEPLRQLAAELLQKKRDLAPLYRLARG